MIEGYKASVARTSPPSPSHQISPAGKILRPAMGEFARDEKKNLVMGTATATRIIAAAVHSYAQFPDRILFVNQNGFLAEYEYATGEIATIQRPGFFISDQQFQFIPSLTGEIAILDSAGGVFMLTPANNLEIFQGQANTVSFDAAGQKLLVVKPQTIEVIWREANRIQPFQKKGTREEIFHSNQPILDAHWFFEDNAHIALRTKDEILLVELDGRGGRNSVPLVSEKTDELITLPDLPNTIFFRIEKRWYKIEL